MENVQVQVEAGSERIFVTLTGALAEDQTQQQAQEIRRLARTAWATATGKDAKTGVLEMTDALCSAEKVVRTYVMYAEETPGWPREINGMVFDSPEDVRAAVESCRQVAIFRFERATRIQEEAQEAVAQADALEHALKEMA